ncbi:UNVERIFIED_CONTAM: hypothetical protein GTU68_024538 [Idotea baltica]|nr:hypothetical protein [Idotea baltica]
MRSIIFLISLVCCLASAPVNSIAQNSPSTSGAEQNNPLPFSVPKDLTELPEFALVVTTKGPFEIKLFRELAPTSVANFRHLGLAGFYEGIAFHRFVPNFVIQGGDPIGNGKGGPGWRLLPEISSSVTHVVGTVGWARKKAERNPQRLSSGSQFYICLSPQPRLDGFYSAFGVVVKGMENVK